MNESTWLSHGETCEETLGVDESADDGYLRCGAPAVMIVYHGRSEHPYRMCRLHGTHNVSNRGAIELVPREK
jgi:hypothetical protein